mmetsp:Transcript_35295/g.76590  ORF Transcript_35295/g.76590 Transcript_35295/m.76590 type:complete len:699 (-) Transcript_35295:40-2136(-)
METFVSSAFPNTSHKSASDYSHKNTVNRNSTADTSSTQASSTKGKGEGDCDDDVTVGTSNTHTSSDGADDTLLSDSDAEEMEQPDITVIAARQYQKKQLQTEARHAVGGDNGDDDDDDNEEPDITVIAARRYQTKHQTTKQLRAPNEEEEEEEEEPSVKVLSVGQYTKQHECNNKNCVPNDDDSFASSDMSWMQKPIGGENGEAIPASYIPPPGKRVESQAPETLCTEGIETILSITSNNNINSEELSVETRSVNSVESLYDQQPIMSTKVQCELSKPLAFAPRPLSKVRTTLSQYNERLFGDKRPNERTVDETTSPVDPPDSCPRVLLPNEVFYNAATKLWVATLHTDQKSLDRGDNTAAIASVQAYSFHTESKAREAVIALAPPRMKSFADNTTCFDCGGKFAFFRRACHCRNCGVCICKIDCSVQWPHQSLPETYNIKDENVVNVCRTCQSLSDKFRNALLAGDLATVVELHQTNNINLRSPFASVKGEIMYPLHCAVLGGNLELIQWLVDIRWVPLKSSKKKRNSSRDGTIATSKGRSVLDLSLSSNNVDVVRYLVVDKKVSLLKYRDLGNALVTLDNALKRITTLSGNTTSSDGEGERAHNDNLGNVIATRSNRGDDNTTGARTEETENNDMERVLSDSTKSEEESCIICCGAKIDCVIIPCGHQICCLGCSSEMHDCPICGTRSSFLRTFKP